MAGLLAYAAEGGLAGAGKGLEQVGATALKDQMDQGLMRLQNTYAQQRQQAEFGHQETMQHQQQEFETARTEREIAGHSATAHFVQEETGKRAAIHEAESTKRTQISAESRVKAAEARNAGAAAKANAPKPWQITHVNVNGFDEHNLPKNSSIALLHNPNTGALYAQQGDALVRWNASTNTPMLNADQLNKARASVGRDEIQRLFNDPNGIIPQGYKGSGMTNLENFERLHHFLPSGIQARTMQGGMVNNNNPDAVGGADQSNEDASAEAAQSEQEREDNEPAVEPE